MIIPMNKPKLSEPDLIAATLLILAKADVNKLGPLQMSQIKDVLEKTFPLADADKAPLKDRTDNAFSQIIRNLTSHKTLEKTGWVKYYTADNNNEGLRGYAITNKGKAHLLNIFANGVRMPNPLLPAKNQIIVPKIPNNKPAYKEDQIIEAALLVLVKGQQAGKRTMPMSKIKACLEDLLTLSFADLLPLKNRSDFVFTQIVRNLTSHNTLEKNGLVKRYTKLNNDAGLEGYQITVAGKNFLLNNLIAPLPDPTIRSLADIKADSIAKGLDSKAKKVMAAKPF